MAATITMPTTSSRHRPVRRHVPAAPVRRHDARRPGSAPRPRVVSEATYRRRRAVVGITTAAIVAIGMVATHDVLAGSGGVPASAAASQPAHVRSTITAQPGDTLWSIAEAHHGDVSLTRYVDKLVDLNGGPTIRAGQRVVLP